MSKNWLDVQSGKTRKVKKPYYVIDSTTRKVKKGYTVRENFARCTLPSGYAQVEYIESSGTQYIDTGVYPTQNVRYALDFVWPVLNNSTSLFGSQKATGQDAALIAYYTSSTGLSFYVGTSKGILQHNNIIAGIKHRLDVHASNGTLTVSMDDVTTTGAYSGSLYTGYSVLIMANKQAGNAVQISSYKLYSFWMWVDGSLVRDYVPCIDPNGAVGLYDMVNGVFYGNAGTGFFTAGPTYAHVARLFYSGGMEITYTGTHTISDVTKDGVAYKLYTLTKTGTLTIDGDGEVQYWMCGGGAPGNSAGGGGAYTKSGTLAAGTHTVTIGAANGNTKIGSVTASKGGTSSAGTAGGSSGTGGGGWAKVTGSGTYAGGSGDGVSKYPFGLTSLYAHCAGGGGGGATMTTSYIAHGGKGGTNGGSGSASTARTSGSGTANGGSGGTRGGGAGGSAVSDTRARDGSDATFYGSGGGGAGHCYTSADDDDLHGDEGKGYQGVCYLLVPA